jgi:hypothetical protein
MWRDVQQGYQLAKIALNFFDTLVPLFLRSLDSCWPSRASLRVPPALINHARPTHRRCHSCIQRARGAA